MEQTKNDSTTILKQIPIIKLILLFGVVLIHSNFSNLINDTSYNNLAFNITTYISSCLMSACVPCYFIISGYLFFNNISKLTLNLYLEKLHRRVYTLLIPYILWNLFCFVLLVIKSKYLGLNGLGIVVNGHIEWLKALEGFWSVPDMIYPLAFAFWFIRNLMVFCILTPIIYLICKYKIVFALYLLITFFIDDTWELKWFIIGAAFAIYRINVSKIYKPLSIFSFMLFLITSLLHFHGYNIIFDNIIFSIFVLSFLIMLISISEKISTSSKIKHIKYMTNASFFIYAFHQCYISILARSLISAIGLTSFSKYIICYILEFSIMIIFSTLIYSILKFLSPKLLNIICGSRT